LDSGHMHELSISVPSVVFGSRELRMVDGGCAC
jgi:hypothetical protein